MGGKARFFGLLGYSREDGRAVDGQIVAIGLAGQKLRNLQSKVTAQQTALQVLDTRSAALAAERIRIGDPSVIRDIPTRDQAVRQLGNLADEERKIAASRQVTDALYRAWVHDRDAVVDQLSDLLTDVEREPSAAHV
jgi:hypothetical protein